MANLYLYKDVAPNQKGGIHIIPTNEAAYTTYLPQPDITLDSGTYEVVNNVIRISGVAQEELKRITYVRYDDGADISYFHVLDCQNVSGYGVLYIAPDDWANNILNVSGRVEVMQCNKLLSLPSKIPYAPEAKGSLNFRKFTNAEIAMPSDFIDLYIVYVCAHETGKASPITGGAGAEASVFIHPVTFAESNPIKDFPELQIACAFIGGIFEAIPYESGVVKASVNASTIRAYIVPKSWVNAAEYSQSTLSGIWGFNSAIAATTVTWTAWRRLNPCILTKRIPLDGQNATHEYFVGTLQNKMPILRVADNNNDVDLHISIKQDGLQILLEQNGNMQDITSAFEVGLTTNGGNITGFEQVKNAIGTLTNVIGNAARIGAGDVVGGAGGLATGILSGFTDTGRAVYRAGGDGAQTWNYQDGTFDCRFGLWYYYYPEIASIVAQYGAQYQGITTMQAIKNASYIDTQPVAAARTYLKGRFVDYIGTAQANAFERINNTLQQGVVIEFV